MTPSARCLQEGRKRGWLIDVVERRIQRIVTKDLFGCIDLVALDGQPGLLGIQATSRSNVRSRVKKIQTECWPAMERWLQAGNRLQVWGWGKLRGRSGGRPLWKLLVLDITPEGVREPGEALEAGPGIDLGAGEAQP